MELIKEECKFVIVKMEKKNDVILEPCETREHRMCNAVE